MVLAAAETEKYQVKENYNKGENNTEKYNKGQYLSKYVSPLAYLFNSHCSFSIMSMRSFQYFPKSFYGMGFLLPSLSYLLLCTEVEIN